VKHLRFSKFDVVRHALLILFAISIIFPVIWFLRMAFMTRFEAVSVPPKLFWWPTLDYVIGSITGYVPATGGTYAGGALAGFEPLPRFLMNNLIICGCTTIITLLLSIPAAYSLARVPFKHNETVFFFMLTTRMGPPISFAFPFYFMMYSLKLIDTYPGIIMVYVFMNTAFTVWVLRGFFEAIPIELEEAARVDGLTQLQTFMKISVPLCIPGVIVTAILTFIFSWNEYLFSSILTYDAAKTVQVILPLYLAGIEQIWPMLAAGALNTFIISFSLWIIGRRYLMRGLILK